MAVGRFKPRTSLMLSNRKTMRPLRTLMLQLQYLGKVNDEEQQDSQSRPFIFENSSLILNFRKIEKF